MSTEQTISPTGGRKTAGSVLLTGGAQALRMAISIISTIILARLLLPSDFGLIATAAPILNFAMVLQTLGFNQAIIQRKEIDAGQISTLFWLSLTVSVALALAVIAGAPWFAAFFAQPQLETLLIGISGLLVIAALGAQPSALLTRQLRFKAIAVIDIAGAMLGFVLTVAVAYATRSYWALYIPTAATLVVNLVGASALTKWRVGRPRFDGSVRDMIGFGASVSTFNLLNFLSKSVDKVLIAKAYGPDQLGLYDRATRLMTTPLAQASSPITRVLTPTLSRLQDQPERYRRTYLDAASCLMLLLHPPLLTAVVFSDAAITVLLGERWVATAPIFMWLGLLGLQQFVTGTLEWLFISQQRSRDFALLGAFSSAAAVLSFVAGLPWGPLGVAISYAIVDTLIKAPVMWYVAGRHGPVSRTVLTRLLAPHLIVLAIVTAALLVAKAEIALPGFWTLVALTLLAWALNTSALCLFPEKRRLLMRLFGLITERFTRSGQSSLKN